MVSLVHKFVSAVADDPTVPGEVRPSNWNDSHALTGGANGQLVFDFNGEPAETTSPIVLANGSGLSFIGPNITNTTGADLVTDGNLATDPTLSGWALNDNTWSAGQISGTLVDVTLGDVEIVIPINPVSNTWYVVEFHATILDGEGPAVYFDGAGGGGSNLSQLNSPIPPLTGPQVYKVPIYCAVGGANHLILDMQFYLFNGASWTVTFVSMKPMATPLPSPQIEVINWNGVVVFDTAGIEYQGYTALGNGALKAITSGTCIGIGTNAGASLTTENRVVAIGNMAMALAINPEFSVAIGDFALLTSQSGGFNTAIGSECLYSCLTGHHNQAIGPNSMFALTSGSYNHGLGEHTGLNLTTGSHNVMLGYGAGGQNLITGSFNILLGDQADVPSDQSDYLNIGGAIIGNYSTGPLAVGVPWIQTAIQKAGLPANTDIAAGQAAVFKDTSGGGVYLAYNDAGTIKKVALT